MVRVVDGPQGDDGVLSPSLGAGGRNQPCVFDGRLAHPLLSHHGNSRSTNTATIICSSPPPFHL